MKKVFVVSIFILIFISCRNTVSNDFYEGQKVYSKINGNIEYIILNPRPKIKLSEKGDSLAYILVGYSKYGGGLGEEYMPLTVLTNRNPNSIFN